jgi:hypothetical protein
MKFTFIVILLLGTQALAGELPEAPVPRNLVVQNEQPQLNFPRRRILDKRFVFAHVALFGSVIFDTEVTHQGLAHHNCVESRVGLPHPTRGRLYASDLSVAAAITAFDYLLQWHHVRSVPYKGDRVGQYLPETGAIVGTIKKFYAGTEWFTHKCF